MNAIVVQGMGETLEGLSTLIQSQLQVPNLAENVKKPLSEAREMIVLAKYRLVAALAISVENELNPTEGE